MINKTLETLYTKVFINIIVQDEETIVYVEICSKDKVIDTQETSFNAMGMSTELYAFVKSYIDLSPYHYIAILDKSPAQGAVPACISSDINKFVDSSSVKSICVSDSWAYYSPEYDIKELKYEYQSFGLDFIFSPFSILNNFYQDKINNNLAIFLLVESKHISLCVFENSTLLYADYLDMQNKVDSSDMMMDISLDDDDDDISLDIGNIDLDDISTDDDIGSLEDFSNIEDLDTDIELDEFSEAKDIKQIMQTTDDEVSADGFNEDYKRFNIVQDSINLFYKSDKYESKFIETLYVADGIGVSSDLKKYFEEEMFLSVIIRKISLTQEVCNMAKAELS